MTDLGVFNSIAGPAREAVDSDELPTLPLGSSDEDARRIRAKFVDGRFLTARDLTREQQYALIRQADLGQLTGGGVINGLEVAVGANARTLSIATGQGLAPNGETIVLRNGLTLPIATIPIAERLGGSLDLDFTGDSRVESRSGVFVAALRAVEYVEQPTIAFPTTVNGKASVEHAQIVEATALAFIPLDNVELSDDGLSNRAVLAREMFLRGGLQKPSGEALPIAVVALDRGSVVWIDQHLVRRRAGIEDVTGFGLAERVGREAYFYQFSAALDDVVKARLDSGRDRRVRAREHFDALPPVGWLPRESVEVVNQQLVQWFFPAAFNVQLSVIPEDELPRLIEDALALAPFDLAAPEEALETAPVLILIPVPRAEFSARVAEVETRTFQVHPPQTQRPTMRVQPIQALDALRRNRFKQPELINVPINLAPWENLLARISTLYFVRRRQFSPTSYIVPRFRPVSLADTDPVDVLGVTVRTRLLAANEIERPATGPLPLRRLDFVLRRVAEANRLSVFDEVRSLFELPAFDTTVSAALVLVNGAAAELAYRARVRLEDLRRSQPATTLGARPPIPALGAGVRVRALQVEDATVTKQRYSAAQIGDGFASLIAVEAGLNDASVREVISQTLLVPELDAAAATLTGADVATFATELHVQAKASNLDAIFALLTLAQTPRASGEPLRVIGE